MFGFLAPVLGGMFKKKVAGALIGAAGSALSARQQAKSGRLDLAYLRSQAEANGFNPLTVLEATGGQGSRTAETPGFLSFLAGNVGQMATNWHTEQSNAKHTQAQIDNLNSNTRYNDAMTAQATVAGSIRGSQREPDYMDTYMANPDGYTTMRTVAGHPIEVRNDVLARLDLPPNSLYGMAEDSEMIFGEIGGEITGAGNVADDAFGANPITKGNTFTPRKGNKFAWPNGYSTGDSSFRPPVVRDMGSSVVKRTMPSVGSNLPLYKPTNMFGGSRTQTYAN